MSRPVLVSFSVASLLFISCGKKESSKSNPMPGGDSSIQKTESPVVGNLKRSGAIKSALACTQNYVPGNEEALESMKNEYFTNVDSCVDAKFVVACVYNDLTSFPASQQGFINWYSAGSECAKDYTQFTDERAAMEFLQTKLQAK